MCKKLWGTIIFGLAVLVVLPNPSEAKPLEGTGRLSGTVTATAQFSAAQIYALNVDKHIQSRDALNDLHLPNYRYTRAEWEVGVDLLLNVGGPRGTLHRSVFPRMPGFIAPSTISLHPIGDIEITSRNTLSAHDRELILDYLVENFGPETGAQELFDPRSKDFTYFPSSQRSSFPKMEITSDGAVWFGPRDGGHPRVSVLYPDMDKMTTLAAYY